MNILIVEDDLLTAQLLRRDLEEAGHIITAHARTFSEAMMALRRNPPDFAILDISLGGNTNTEGIEVANWIGEFSNIPFVFLTGHDNPPPGAELTQSYGYVKKPYDKAQLLIQIRFIQDRFEENRRKEESRQFPDSFYLRINGEHIHIRFEDLLYVQAERKNVSVHTVFTGKNPYLIGTNLGDVSHFFDHPLLVSLPPSLIVNSNHIRVIKDHELELGPGRQKVRLSGNARKMLVEKLYIVKTRSKKAEGPVL